MSKIKEVFQQIVRNEQSVFLYGCTEASERLLGLIYLYWSVTVDMNQSAYYHWLHQPSPMFWQVLAFVIAISRLVAGSLGGKMIRVIVAAIGAAFSLTLSLGFFGAGFLSGGFGHGLFAATSLWIVYRLVKRLMDDLFKDTEIY